MSKSDTGDGSVGILESPDSIIKKFKRAVTDSDCLIKYMDGKDGINNLLSIYCAFTDKTLAEAEKEFEGCGYGEFKMAVADACIEKLRPIQDQFKTYMADKAQLDKILKDNSEKAAYIARKTLSKVYRKVGFVQI